MIRFTWQGSFEGGCQDAGGFLVVQALDLELFGQGEEGLDMALGQLDLAVVHEVKNVGLKHKKLKKDKDKKLCKKRPRLAILRFSNGRD